MPKFTGFIVSKKPSIMRNDVRGLLVNTTRMNGDNIVDADGVAYKLLVDVKDQASNWDHVRGLTQGSLVEFEAETIAEHEPGRDLVLAAKGNYPARPVHQLVKYVRGSLRVLKAVVPMNLTGAGDDATVLATPEELKAAAAKLEANSILI